MPAPGTPTYQTVAIIALPRGVPIQFITASAAPRSSLFTAQTNKSAHLLDARY